MDILNGDQLDRLKEELEEKGYKIYPVSAATREGIEELKYGMWELLSQIEDDYETFDEEIEYFEEEIEEDEIIVEIRDGEYIVEGSFIERLLESIYFDNVDSLRYFQDTLRRKGVVDKLRELGIEEEDSVFICEHEFEFFE